jgi:2-oxoglutarate ferredoxin oxidoreductase subunit alpha
VLVFEVNAGQMIDDVRLSVGGRVPVAPVGRVSIDFSGMRQGEILTVPWIRDRVRQAIGEVRVS